MRVDRELPCTFLHYEHFLHSIESVSFSFRYVLQDEILLSAFLIHRR